MIANRVAAIRAASARAGGGAADAAREFERACIILSLEFEEHGFGSVLLLIVVFVALGFGVEWLF